MAVLVIVLFVFSIVPSTLYFAQRRGRGPGWGFVTAGEETRGQGAYRETHVVRWKRGKAPMVVRVAALSSFFLGQMVVPGALAAIAGIVAVFVNEFKTPMLCVMVLSAPTGLAVAVFLLSAGWTMLESGSRAVFKARRAAKWAIGHNLALLVALGVCASAGAREAEMAAPTLVYIAVSIVQALVVLRAARAIEVYDEAQKNAPAPLDAVLAIGLGDPLG